MNGEKSIYNETDEKAHVNEPVDEFHSAESSAENASEEARDWVQDRQDEIRDTLQKIANDYSERSKTAVSSRLSHYKKALTAASESLQEDGEERAADLLSSAAERVNESASKLRESTPAELLGAVEEQARRSPWIAVAAAAFMGLALSRFVNPRPEDEEYDTQSRSL